MAGRGFLPGLPHS